LHFLPVSALAGDNVTLRSAQTPWYAGPSLLELLEAVRTTETDSHAPFRLPVQRVVRPNLDFRGFAGQIAAGSIKPGDQIMALPSRRTSRVKEIVTFSGNLPHAHAPQSVTLTLEDELDISRGDLLVPAASPATATTHFVASLVWMDGEPLALNRRYLLKHTSRTVNASVAVLRHRLDITTLEEQPADTLELNSIGVVEITSSQPLFVDAYTANRHTGSFVLIDPVTNATAAAGMIRDLAGRHNLAESPRREAFADAESMSETTRRRMLVQLEEIAAFFAASEPTSQLAAALGVARKLILPDAHDDSGPTDSSAVQEEESR
jgi:sulfate adenylyltransferase subunit 1 (EFTu-like GTPase family)